jgi:nucleoside-diphosphate-sugar epimerase
MDDRIKTISINTTATAALLRRLENNGRFLFLSSSEVYSGSSSLSNSEVDIGTTDPSHPRACYIEGKRTGETIVNAARDSGINAASARLALAYGPGTRLDDQRVMNQLIVKGFHNKITLLDSGAAVRTYGYISDVVIMLLNILLSNQSAVYNVGGKSVTTIKELAIKIANVLGVPVKTPEIEAYMNHAPKTVGLDLGRVESEYDFKADTDFYMGLNKTIAWVRALDSIG